MARPQQPRRGLTPRLSFSLLGSGLEPVDEAAVDLLVGGERPRAHDLVRVRVRVRVRV